MPPIAVRTTQPQLKQQGFFKEKKSLNPYAIWFYFPCMTIANYMQFYASEKCFCCYSVPIYLHRDSISIGKNFIFFSVWSVWLIVILFTWIGMVYFLNFYPLWIIIQSLMQKFETAVFHVLAKKKLCPYNVFYV